MEVPAINAHRIIVLLENFFFFFKCHHFIYFNILVLLKDTAGQN